MAARRRRRSLCLTSTPTTPRSRSCTGRATKSGCSRSPTRTTPSTGPTATTTPGWQKWLAAGQSQQKNVLESFLKCFHYRLIIERFANISDGTVVGVRAPFLRVGGRRVQISSDDHCHCPGWRERAVRHDGRSVLRLRLLHHCSS